METLRELMAAGGVLLLLAGCLWVLRRRGLALSGKRGGRGRVVQVVERTALSQQHSLHLVRVAGRGLLVSVSPGGCAVLERFEWNQLEKAAGAAAEAGR